MERESEIGVLTPPAPYALVLATAYSLRSICACLPHAGVVGDQLLHLFDHHRFERRRPPRQVLVDEELQRLICTRHPDGVVCVPTSDGWIRYYPTSKYTSKYTFKYNIEPTVARRAGVDSTWREGAWIGVVWCDAVWPRCVAFFI